MQMNVEDALAGFSIRVEDRAESAIGVPVLSRNGRRAADHRSDELIVYRREIVQRSDVSLRNDQHVQRSLRVDVLDDDDTVVLIYGFDRNLPRDHVAEQAISHSIVRRQITVRGMSCKSWRILTTSIPLMPPTRSVTQSS